MRVLVTGATSDTGARLCRRLLAEGAELTCVVRRPGSAPGGAREVLAPLPKLAAAWDPAARASFSAAARGAELAFLVTPIGLAVQPLALLRDAGVPRTVCVSSTRRFTRWPDEPARAVIAAEEALTHGGGGFVALRSTMIYGGPRDKNIRRWMKLLERLPVFPLPGGGKALIQPIYIDDLVTALRRAAATPGLDGAVLEVAGPRPLSMREAAATIARVRELRRWLVPVPLAPARWAARWLRPSLEPIVRRMGEDRVADITRARELLAFEPRELAQGVRDMLASNAGDTA